MSLLNARPPRGREWLKLLVGLVAVHLGLFALVIVGAIALAPAAWLTNLIWPGAPWWVSVLVAGVAIFLVLEIRDDWKRPV
jgi:sterol desaturase/sphingolipid hydroxylase (fatty acid hydroxylase superfamily)